MQLFGVSEFSFRRCLERGPVYPPSNTPLNLLEQRRTRARCSSAKTYIPHMTNAFRTRKTNLTERRLLHLPTARRQVKYCLYIQ